MLNSGNIMGIIIGIIGVIYVIISKIRLRKTVGELDRSLDMAIKGEKIDVVYDEKMISALENKMNKFINMNYELKNSLKDEKERIHELISDISHQTKTPIANIMMYSQLAGENISEENPLGDMVNVIVSESDKLDFLIESLMKASRLESGIIRVDQKENNLGELIKKVCSKGKLLAENKGISFSCEDVDMKCNFDMKWTEEALFNIVHNAVKYTEPGGAVSISIEKYQLFCRVDIQDTGIGMKEEEYSKIFKRFYRSASVSQLEGVGIGLFISRKIISEQGGYIKVQSEEGIGSKFSLFIPR